MSVRTAGPVAVIVLAQWFGTTMWFSPSGVSAGLSIWLDLAPGAFGWLVAATQLGFIGGTVVSAISGVADRFSAERIFVSCSLLGAVLNGVWTLAEPSFPLAFAARFGVGFALAGIYPLGMKMIVQRSGGRSGQALAWLIAMLTLGTTMPYVLGSWGAELPWQAGIWGSSVLALCGAALVGALPQRPGSRSAPDASPAPARAHLGGAGLRQLAGNRSFRASCAGYVGHMWELYAFWAVAPLLVMNVLRTAEAPAAPAPLTAVVIGVGAVGCVLGGWMSRRWRGETVAASALAASGLMCLLFPLLPHQAPALKLLVLVLWGFFVIADSPQFAEMTARYVPQHLVGTALTVQNSIGFLATVISIVTLQVSLPLWGEFAVWLLVPGPLLGLLALRPFLRSPGFRGAARGERNTAGPLS